MNRFHNVNISVAVQTDQGLMVPVVKVLSRAHLTIIMALRVKEFRVVYMKEKSERVWVVLPFNRSVRMRLTRSVIYSISLYWFT